MRAGKLRFRLELQRPVEMRDDLGGVRQDWETVATLWCDITPGKGREFVEAQKIEPRLTHQISLRHYPGLTPQWRLRLAGTARVFQPFSIADAQERHRETVIFAVEVV